MLSDIDDSSAERAVSQLSSEGIKAPYTHCDVSRKDQVQNLIHHTVQQLGSIDIVVANAGMYFIAGYAWAFVLGRRSCAFPQD